jgi:hypothetical protein
MAALSYVVCVLPFEERGQNALEIFNESCFIACSYSLLLLTDFMPDKARQYNVGWALVAITCLNILVNLSLIVYAMFLTAKRAIRKAWIKCKTGKAKKSSIKYHWDTEGEGHDSSTSTGSTTALAKMTSNRYLGARRSSESSQMLGRAPAHELSPQRLSTKTYPALDEIIEVDEQDYTTLNRLKAGGAGPNEKLAR